LAVHGDRAHRHFEAAVFIELYDCRHFLAAFGLAALPLADNQILRLGGAAAADENEQQSADRKTTEDVHVSSSWRWDVATVELSEKAGGKARGRAPTEG